MKAFISYLLLAGLFCLPLGGETLTQEQIDANTKSFDYIWQTVRDNHWDPDMGGLDWDAVRVELRPKVAAAKTMDEARRVMYDMLGRLKLSHFSIIPQEAYRKMAGTDMPEVDGHTGMDVRVLDGTAVVTNVDEGSPADKAGIRPGWQVLRINDETLADLLPAIIEAFKGSITLELNTFAAITRRLRGPVGKDISLVLKDGNGKEHSLALQLAEPKGKPFQLGFLPPIAVWLEQRRLPGDIGYIAFNSFMDPSRIMPLFNEAMASFQNTRGLVIDLRGNLGGMGIMAMGMMGWFCSEKGHNLGVMRMRGNELKLAIMPRPNVYQAPVAVLIDGVSISCAEFMAQGFKDLGRGRLFGSNSCGMALPSQVKKLPNGDGLQFVFAYYESEKGHVLEGKGVAPDETVVLDTQSLLQGKDPVLAAASAWINEQHTK